MKKLFIILALTCASYSSAFALNLDKIIKVADEINNEKHPKKIIASVSDNINKKIEKKIDKVTGRIEKRIDKYEKKLDRYEKKMDEVEKTADDVIELMSSISKSEIAKYIAIIKYLAIGTVILFISSFLMLLVIFKQNLKIKSLLQKK